MEKEFVPYELALKMKEFGFDEECFGSYYLYKDENHQEGKFDYRGKLNIEFSIYTNNKYYILAPTWQSAFRWFREKYGLYSWIQLHNGYINDSFYSELPITFSIMDRKTGNKYYERDIPHNYLYKTNEEAELECLKKLIEIVKEKQL
jgi:hypothetical protein